MLLTYGLLTPSEIDQLAELWKELPSVLPRDAVVWAPILDGARMILFPRSHVAYRNEPSVKASRQLAEIVLSDVIEMTSDHPGVQSRAVSLAASAGLSLQGTLDAPYELLFGSFNPRNYYDEGKRIAAGIADLAQDWALEDPKKAIPRLQRLKDEAVLAGSNDDRFWLLVIDLAQRVPEPKAWIEGILASTLSPGCLGPLFSALYDVDPDGWKGLVRTALEYPRFRIDAIMVLVTHDDPPEDLMAQAIPFMDEFIGRVRVAVLRDEVPDNTLKRLLTASGAVAGATVVALHERAASGRLDKDTESLWGEAVVAHLSEEYWTGEILGANPVLAERWLVRLLRDDPKQLRLRHDLPTIVQAMDSERRFGSSAQSARGAKLPELVNALVDKDVDLFSQVLCDAALASTCTYPLGRDTDATWADFVEVACERSLTRPHLRATFVLEHSS